MIDEIYVIQRDSGLTFFHMNFQTRDQSEVPDSDLVGGAIQAIRILMHECKIGELNEFTTHTHRIEMRCDSDLIFVLIADLQEPSHGEIDEIVEDLLVIFVNLYRKEIREFAGNINVFDGFKETIEQYLKLRTQVQKDSAKNEKPLVKEGQHIKSQKITSTGGLDPEINLAPLIEWLKNRYNPNAEVKADVKIICPPENAKVEAVIPTSLLMDCGERKLSRIDQWMASHIGKNGYREVILVIGLNPTHGPATIESILAKVQNIGDPAFNEDKKVFQWFPTEVLFVGPALQKSTFNGLDKIIKSYKNQKIIVPNYSDHIHREHSPHHVFYRCRISGWNWKLGNVTAENSPQQVFPISE